MKIPSAIRILLKALLVPLIAVFFLNQFNIFEYITFVPEDYKFDVGLTPVSYTHLDVYKRQCFCSWFYPERTLYRPHRD